MKEVINCINCNSRNLKKIAHHVYYNPGDEHEMNVSDLKHFRLWILFNHILKEKRNSIEFDIVYCKNCGFIFSNPRFSFEEMKVKYVLTQKYNSVKQNVLNYPETNVDKRAKRIFELVSKWSSINEGTVLDYGGQKGDNLKYFRLNGYNCQVVDYEKWDMHEEIEYIGEDLSSVKEKPDIILCNHTLEHVINPMNFIKEIKRIMKDDSLFYIEVPLGAFYWEYIKKMKRDPLTHVNFFSEQSLVFLFKNAGFNVKLIDTQYQYLQTVKQWCINIIVSKENKDTRMVKPLSTRRQLYMKYFYLSVMVKNRLFHRFNNFLDKLKIEIIGKLL